MKTKDLKWLEYGTFNNLLYIVVTPQLQGTDNLKRSYKGPQHQFI